MSSTHFPPADRPRSALPKFPSQTLAALRSQTRVHFPLMIPFSPLPRISCCWVQMFSTAEVAGGAGGCQTGQEVRGCPHLLLTCLRGRGCLSPALEPEPLANFSKLRFRNDLNTETLFLEKVCDVQFRDYECPSRAKPAQRFPPRIAFWLLPHYFSLCFTPYLTPSTPTKNTAFSVEFRAMALFLVLYPFFCSFVPRMLCSANSQHSPHMPFSAESLLVPS